MQKQAFHIIYPAYVNLDGLVLDHQINWIVTTYHQHLCKLAISISFYPKHLFCTEQAL